MTRPSPIVVQHFLTLTQPWATLMAIGAKKIETRGWPIRFRGWFAIHASKAFPRECRTLCYREPFASALAAAKYNAPEDLPLGQVLAVAFLYECQPSADLSPLLTYTERSFGDYTAGRYGFMTDRLRRLREPFALRGLQRLQRLPAPILEKDLL